MMRSRFVGEIKVDIRRSIRHGQTAIPNKADSYFVVLTEGEIKAENQCEVQDDELRFVVLVHGFWFK
jgi:hypothetical protein